MNVIAIDPGMTSGWVCYCTEQRRVLNRGTFLGFVVPHDVLARIKCGATCVVESFDDVHAGIYPQTVHAAEVLGRICERVWQRCDREPERITRHDVKKVLHGAIFGEWPIKKDRDVWHALLKLHGGPDAAKKGGPLADIVAKGNHERAALAVAVAWVLRAAVTAEVRT